MSQSPIFTRIVQMTGDLPSMPHVATLVMQKMADPRATARDLHEIISQDQAMTAKILKIANSTFYGSARNVSRLTDAIVVMGFNAIRSLVMASALNDFLKSYGLIEKLLWEHSMGCAALSKKIAKTVRYSNTEEAFLAGLMHDIGKVVINLKLPDKMREVVQEVYYSPEATFARVEQEILGFDHAQVGRLVARKWRFTDEMEEAIGCHLRPEEATILPALSHIVHLANGFCHKLEIGPTRNRDLNIAELTSAKTLKIDQNTIDRLLEEMTQELQSSQDAFTI